MLDIAGGKLAGTVAEPIFGRDGKRATLIELRNRLGLAARETLAIGDGANDMDMIAAAGLGIAFHAKPKVAAAAPARVDHGDLTALLYVQGYRKTEFVAALVLLQAQRHKTRIAIGAHHQQHDRLLAVFPQLVQPLLQFGRRGHRLLLHLGDHHARLQPLLGGG